MNRSGALHLKPESLTAGDIIAADYSCEYVHRLSLFFPISFPCLRSGRLVHCVPPPDER